jgi:hypothetical protein
MIVMPDANRPIAVRKSPGAMLPLGSEVTPAA